jgi:hypothetical protein
MLPKFFRNCLPAVANGRMNGRDYQGECSLRGLILSIADRIGVLGRDANMFWAFHFFGPKCSAIIISISHRISAVV